jgi:NADPH:quinone reductase-like Zn-dependent oxidoreductase
MKSERPGVDVAGEIIAVGKKVRQFKPGDAVFGAGKGTFAEYACARECKLAQKPESVSFEQAAAVPIAGITALQALRDAAHLQAGQKVLINGAAGGVGTFAVQIAKSFGAHVTGVCSTKNVELVRSLGADRVIDYTCEDFSEDSERYDLLLDNVGNCKLSAMKSVLRPNGKCVIVGAPKKMSAVLPWLLKILARSLLIRDNFKFLFANISRGDLTTFGELITAGKVTPVIDRRYPLSATAAAMAYAEEGHARGKVIVTFE